MAMGRTVTGGMTLQDEATGDKTMRHDDDKGQNGDRRHDNGDRQHDNNKGQQGDGQHNNGDGLYDDEAHRWQPASR